MDLRRERFQISLRHLVFRFYPGRRLLTLCVFQPTIRIGDFVSVIVVNNIDSFGQRIVRRTLVPLDKLLRKRSRNAREEHQQ